MIKVDFQNNSEEIEVLGKVYKINLSNYTFMKKAQSFVTELGELQAKATESNDLDDSLACIKKIVDFMLGDYDRIWEESGENVDYMIKVTIALKGLIEKGFEYKMGKYL